MKKKIMVLDDSPFMLKVVGDMLRKFNYDVTELDNAQDACQKAAATRYDMIITDMNMPVMDGLEFTRTLKKNPNYKFVPIVMLSSQGNDERIAQAKEIGVSTFLNKPPKEGQLKTLLQITLSKRRAPRIPVKLEVSYRGDRLSPDFNAAYTFNMSLGGLFLETPNPLHPGEDLELKFSLPGMEPPILCQGRVAWENTPGSPCNPSHPSGMGVEFVNLEEEDRFQAFLKSGAWKN